MTKNESFRIVCTAKKRDGELGCRVENALAMAIGNVHNIEKGRKSGKCRRYLVCAKMIL